MDHSEFWTYNERDLIDEATREAQQREVRWYWGECFGPALGSIIACQLPRDLQERLVVTVARSSTAFIARFLDPNTARCLHCELEVVGGEVRIPDEVIAHLCVVV
jgi:hypothetical protein